MNNQHNYGIAVSMNNQHNYGISVSMNNQHNYGIAGGIYSIAVSVTV